MTKKRLSKALAAAGIASRRGAEELIFEGRVQVNGQVVLLPQTLVNWEEDEIRLDAQQITKEEEKVSYVLNKPKGFLCTNVRPGKKAIVLDLFPHVKERLYTVGRLDKETTGLLIVTNDGHLAQRIIHPSSNLEKEYLVKAVQEITPEHLEILFRGARVENRWVRPTVVKKIRRGSFTIAVKEGKKHEVRILAKRANLDVIELKRIRIGGLVLGSLASGTFRPFTKKDEKLLFGIGVKS